jgi:hypothetical protein
MGCSATSTAVDLAAEEPAVPAGGGDRWAGRDDSRSHLVAGREPVAQRERQVGAVAEVADGRDADRQCSLRRESHTQQQRDVVVGLEAGDGIARRVERQVLVDIDEPREQGHVAEIYEARVR